MKKQLFPVALLALSGQFPAKLTSTENYIQSKTCLNDDCTKKTETVIYYDGLGRPKQIINVKATPMGKDLVTPVTYDGFGRQTKEILPTPISSLNSAIHLGITNESAANSYYGVTNAYSEKEIENSPLDRVLQQGHAGDAWKLNSGHTQKIKYEANTTGEVLNFVTNTTWLNGATSSAISLATGPNSENGHYKAAQLYKTTVTDEDGNPAIQFTNGEGQTILIRKTDGTKNIDTYYVYNEYNQKAFIIPPKAVKQIKDNGNVVTQTILDDLCYLYRYDGRNKQVENKIPGKGWEYRVYDKQDRIVATRDAELKKNGQWLYTKYDQFGRVAFTGIATGGERNAEQVLANGFGSNNLKRTAAVFFNREGMGVYYDPNGTYPNVNWIKLLSVNYYDTYPPYSFNPPFPNTILGKTTLTDNPASSGKSTKSLLVMSFVKNIEDDNWTKNYSYYDTKGREIGSYSINHLGGYTKTDTELDFAGVAQQTVTRHKRLAGDVERVVTETFTYDHQNRLLTHKHKVDNNPEEILAQNTYNELSQLINKKVGGASPSTPLQSIDYAYNIRGWMTKINDPSNLNGKLFGLGLTYNNPVSASAYTAAKYNGNIAELDWKTANGNVLKRYVYKYDQLDRLTDASYLEPLATVPVTNGYGEFITYDENGNIQTLKRYQANGNTAMLIDDLAYSSYKGNQLITVTDNSTNSSGYPTGGNTIAYDLNGNMISHTDKGISNISYNYLNLPKEVNIDQNNRNLTFIYRADGVKLRKAYNYFASKSGLTIKENTDYLDGFQYEDENGAAVLQFFPTREGYYDFQKKRYVYNYADHVGNIRLAYYRDSGNNVVIDKETNYYPFGLEHADYNGTGTQLESYRYGFQGQEKQKETGWSSFKWRNAIPELGRFFGVDPLSEKYNTWSTYAFSGNRVTDARELEGLEPYIVTGRAFIPQKTLPNPKPFTDTKSFAGDNRNSYNVNATSYRTEQKVRVDFDNNKVTTLSNKASGSTGFDKNGKAIEHSASAKAGPTPTYTSGTMKDGSTTIHMEVDASNKLVSGAPSINYDVDITVVQQKNGSFNYNIEGKTDGFPAYEFFITDEKTGNSYLMYGSNPKQTGDAPTALFPPMEKTVDKTGNSKFTQPTEEKKFK